MPHDEFVNDVAAFAFLFASTDPSQSGHQEFELAAQVQSDPDEDSLRAAIPGTSDEQLDDLISRDEEVLGIRDGLKEAGCRQVKCPFVRHIFKVQKPEHVQQKGKETRIEQGQRNYSCYARLLHHDVARCRILDAAPILKSGGYSSRERGSLHP